MISDDDPAINGITLYERPDVVSNYDMMSGLAWARARITHDACEAFLPPAHNATLLDIGVVTGLSAQPFIDKGFDVIGIDASRVMMAIASSKGIKTLYTDDLETTRLPFEDETFNVVISHGTLYFMRNACAVIGEMLRVAKPNAVLSFNIKENSSGSDVTEHICPTYTQSKTGKKAQENIRSFSHPPQMIIDFLKAHNASLLHTEKFDNSPLKQAPTIFTQFVARKLG